MKKLLTLTLTLLLLCGMVLTASASTVDVSRELINIQASYKEKITLTLYEETLAMASMEWLTGRTPFYPEEDGTVLSLACRVLAYSATASIPEQFPEIDKLAGMQKDDGSFGDTETHCLAMLALRSVNKTYNSPGAYKYLLTLQKEDGTFGESIKETALAMTVLSLSENEQERSTMAATMNYLATYRTADMKELCWQIIALTDCGVNATNTGDTTRLERLLSHQTSTGAFSLVADSEEADEEATVLALLALDAINRDASAYKRLATDGLLKRYSLEDFKSLFMFFGVLLVISAVFWLYVILHKKHDKTLEETKTY
ncbi:MAG: hypothetical protein IJC19_05695 [Clostridia bacterium]|nr:hypothetical protein [Clostridia bacterium]